MNLGGVTVAQVILRDTLQEDGKSGGSGAKNGGQSRKDKQNLPKNRKVSKQHPEEPTTVIVSPGSVLKIEEPSKKGQ